MSTKDTKQSILDNFSNELKKTTDCSDIEIVKFIEFLDNSDQFISEKKSLESSF